MSRSRSVRRMWALDAPTITVDKSILLLGGGGETVTLPAPCFLVEHDEGLVLFDTGLASEAAGDPAAAYGPLAAMFEMTFPEECRLDRQIEALGFRTTDVKRVVLSHAHFDHTGGLHHFTHAEGFVGSGELRYAHNADPHTAGFFRSKDLEAAGRIKWNELPAGYDHDMFGDGSVTLLSLPGHTPGALGLQLRFEDGHTLILTGDAAHLRENIGHTVGMPFDADVVRKLDSLRKLKLLGTRPDVTVWVNHDPQDWATLRATGNEITAASLYAVRS
ncbi:N-acyl homoserine lactonase family protein [Streptomyces cinereoruber]|uniref:N-acyl homoserine lactonase family protein n=1 Tax=Streptomyces cinereoruber TaxID=67260 RepID=A0ABX6BPL0_9ACTN|nr:N-acyl homoserine lactonase family protein [Streptomyces cinereoruber]MBB4158225.1 glyoxylase-like metal-dependent hydrolase (beta-lactamase superfamily II) [Streptomyces cinereoruber]MBY8819241.1 N-acyl homoserine lactonase family protein [Streptomyces cinereoruber]NIH63358.1 glyoxylase-like metal-dependent hydrolase (beta-lactamase superfamily II) [Streptomyces cinereoruber]QEV36015.1 N-acyl homoserine lactonase family protein [Streptomyces cinereoruber]